MRSIPEAMTWELLRHGRWALIGGLLGANLLPALLFTALRLQGVVNPGEPSSIAMHVVLVQLNMFIFAAAVFTAQGPPSRLYAYPLPTSTLVAWHLLPVMVAVAVELVVSTAVLNAVFDLDWPLWGPAMFLATAVAAVQAALWITEKSAWLPVAVAAVAAVVGCWHKSRYGAVVGQPTHYWVEVTPGEVATTAAVAALSYYVAVVAVERNRRGEAPLSLGIIAWFERMFDLTPNLGVHFRTPAQAQFWFEWRKKGWAMPAAVIFGLFMSFSIWLFASRQPQELWQGLIAGGGLLSLLGFIGGLMMGNSGPNDANFELGQFLGTRPMTNTDMARTILKAAAKSVLSAWLIWAVAFLTVYVILVATQVVPRPTLPEGLRWWYFPATLLGPWTVTAIVASMFLAGRAQSLAELLCGSFALFIGLSLFSKYALSEPAQLQFTRGAVVAIAGIFVLGSAWAIIAAYRRSLIGWPTIYVAGSVWAALTAVIVLERALHPGESLAAYLFAVGLAALSVAPLATAPLALAWNRNR